MIAADGSELIGILISKNSKNMILNDSSDPSRRGLKPSPTTVEGGSNLSELEVVAHGAVHTMYKL